MTFSLTQGSWYWSENRELEANSRSSLMQSAYGRWDMMTWNIIIIMMIIIITVLYHYRMNTITLLLPHLGTPSGTST